MPVIGKPPEGGFFWLNASGLQACISTSATTISKPLQGRRACHVLSDIHSTFPAKRHLAVKTISSDDRGRAQKLRDLMF